MYRGENVENWRIKSTVYSDLGAKTGLGAERSWKLWEKKVMKAFVQIQEDEDETLKGYCTRTAGSRKDDLVKDEASPSCLR